MEVCFVDSEADCEIYGDRFKDIIANIVGVFGEDEIEPEPPKLERLFHVKGRCSYFGGPNDMGVSPDEGLAFHYDINPDNEHLFLPLQPDGTTGLARRLNSRAVSYIACRWNYNVTSKDMLADSNLYGAGSQLSDGRGTVSLAGRLGAHSAGYRAGGGSQPGAYGDFGA